MHRSLWLDEALGPGTRPEPRLDGDMRADVAIIGGGYVGLWTAIRIKELDPACDVALVEQDICGGGASGRNGGFVLSWWPKLPTLMALFGQTAAVDLCRASEAAINEIGAFSAAHQIDAHFAPYLASRPGN
jgi:glycine/D-amino acid oxidase-like deaminating enzyme